MMRWTSLLLAILLAGGCATSGGVHPSTPVPREYGYLLSGTNVVFSFRASDYPELTSGATGEWIPIGDVRINRVSVAGEFNRWSTEAMAMARSGEYWVATRPISEFESSRSLQFKFVINGRYWAEPPPDALNRAFTTGGTKIANLVLQIDRPVPPPEAAPHAQPPVHR